MDDSKNTSKEETAIGKNRIERAKAVFELGNEAAGLVYKLALPFGVILGALVAYQYLESTNNLWAFPGLIGDVYTLFLISALSILSTVLFIGALCMPLLADRGLNSPDSQGWHLGLIRKDENRVCDGLGRFMALLPVALLFGVSAIKDEAKLLGGLVVASGVFLLIDIGRLWYQGRIVRIRSRRASSSNTTNPLDEPEIKKAGAGGKIYFGVLYATRIFFLIFPLAVFGFVFTTVFGSMAMWVQWSAIFVFPILICIPYALADLRGYLLAATLILGIAFILLTLAPSGAAAGAILERPALAGQKVDIACISERCTAFTKATDTTLEVVLAVAGRTALAFECGSGRAGVWLDDSEFVIHDFVEDDEGSPDQAAQEKKCDTTALPVNEEEVKG